MIFILIDIVCFAIGAWMVWTIGELMVGGLRNAWGDYKRREADRRISDLIDSIEADPRCKVVTRGEMEIDVTNRGDSMRRILKGDIIEER